MGNIVIDLGTIYENCSSYNIGHEKQQKTMKFIFKGGKFHFVKMPFFKV